MLRLAGSIKPTECLTVRPECSLAERRHARQPHHNSAEKPYNVSPALHLQSLVKMKQDHEKVSLSLGRF